MATSYEHDTSFASSGKLDYFLDFFEVMRLDIKFGSRVEGPGPRVVHMHGIGAKGDTRVDVVHLCFDSGIHCTTLAHPKENDLVYVVIYLVQNVSLWAELCLDKSAKSPGVSLSFLRVESQPL